MNEYLLLLQYSGYHKFPFSIFFSRVRNVVSVSARTKLDPTVTVVTFHHDLGIAFLIGAKTTARLVGI